ncbi:hypothetical protein GCM10020256_52300 [Streptomyces thermocoprophilus]
MGAVPTQRDTDTRTGDAPAPPGTHEPGRTYATLPGGSLAPGTARDLVRAALREWAAEPATPGARLLTDRLAEDAILVVSELVTNAVVHAGTDVGLLCRLEPAGHIVVEVSDQHPTRAPRDSGTGRTAPAAPAYDTPRVRARTAPRRHPRRVLGHHLPARRQDRLGPAVPPTTTPTPSPTPLPVPSTYPSTPPSTSPAASPPRPAAADGTASGWGAARCPSSPRPPICSPGSSTRTWSPRSPDS